MNSFEQIQLRAIRKAGVPFSATFRGDARLRARRADAEAGAFSRKSQQHELRDERAHDAYYDDGRDFSGRYEP